MENIEVIATKDFIIMGQWFWKAKYAGKPTYRK